MLEYRTFRWFLIASLTLLMTSTGCSTVESILGTDSNSKSRAAAKAKRDQERQENQSSEDSSGSTATVHQGVKEKKYPDPPEDDAAQEPAEEPAVDNLEFDRQDMETSTTMVSDVYRPNHVFEVWVDGPVDEVTEETLGEAMLTLKATKDGETFVTHSYPDELESQSGYAFYLVPDPESEESKEYRDSWTGKWVSAFGDLEPGTHEIVLEVYASPTPDTELFLGRGTFKVEKPAEDDYNYEEVAKKIEETRGRDPYKERTEWIEANGGLEAWREQNHRATEERDAQNRAADNEKYYRVTVSNQCSKSLTVTSSNGQTLVLSGKGSGTLKVLRGKSASLSTGQSVSEGNAGGTVVVCQ